MAILVSLSPKSPSPGLNLINSLIASTFTQEQKSDFKFERNNDCQFNKPVNDVSRGDEKLSFANVNLNIAKIKPK